MQGHTHRVLLSYRLVVLKPLRYRKIYNWVVPYTDMKIIKVLSKKVGDTAYQKYLLNLPKEVVEESKLVGKKLKAKAEKEKIVIEKE